MGNVFNTIDHSNRNKVLSQANLSLLDGSNNHETMEGKRRRHASAYGSRNGGAKSVSTTFTDFLHRESQAGAKDPSKLLASKIADTIVNSSNHNRTLDADARSTTLSKKPKTPSKRFSSAGNANLLSKMMNTQSPEERQNFQRLTTTVKFLKSNYSIEPETLAAFKPILQEELK
jgi:hypothetical protein